MSWSIRKFLRDVTNKTEVINMDDEEIRPSVRYALIFGGNSPLGGRCISDLKCSGWWVASIDYAVNSHADVNILLLKEDSPIQQESSIISSIWSLLGGRKLDLIYCVTDAYVEGSAEDNLLGVGMEMWKAHMVPALIIAKLGTLCLRSNGILILQGNALTNKPTPSSVGYGVVKSSVAFLSKCLAESGSGLPGDSIVVCMVPIYMDTALMRSALPHIHPGDFTPLTFVSELILSWGEKKNLPTNGSTCLLVTKNYKTEMKYLDE